MCILNKTIATVTDPTKSPHAQGSTNVYDALGLMESKGRDIIGVECGEHFAGIFTRGDFTKYVLRQNLNPKDVLLYDVMQIDPPFVQSGTSIKDAYEAMLAYQWSFMPVLHGSKLYGIVSLHDLGQDIMSSYNQMQNENYLMLNYIQGGQNYSTANS
tara:strand:- start:370 stop:840 length:471 start_codon:yes stop_codon:yes gene_type:complete